MSEQAFLLLSSPCLFLCSMRQSCREKLSLANHPSSPSHPSCPHNTDHAYIAAQVATTNTTEFNPGVYKVLHKDHMSKSCCYRDIKQVQPNKSREKQQYHRQEGGQKITGRRALLSKIHASATQLSRINREAKMLIRGHRETLQRQARRQVSAGSKGTAAPSALVTLQLIRSQHPMYEV